jgi:hypothetical protein
MDTPVHSNDFQGFSDFPIFRLFAGRKTIWIYRYTAVISRVFRIFLFSDYLPATKPPLCSGTLEFLLDLYFY